MLAPNEASTKLRYDRDRVLSGDPKNRNLTVVHVIIHRMFSLSVSLPVRGADGLAKRAIYGGVERQRLSSQSIKAHLRAGTGLDSPMAYLAKELGTEMSVRSAIIGARRIATELANRGLAEDVANTWGNEVMALFQSGKAKPAAKPAKKGKNAKVDADEAGDDAKDEQDEAAPTDVPGRQILTLGVQEIAALTKVAETLQKVKVDPSAMRELVEK